jgi:alkyl sulfatase BDS1-like metallo-beta-lactamase superfamily hydrolase
VVLTLGRWGSSAPFPDDPKEIGVDSTILALKTMLDPAAAAGLDLEVELRLREQLFAVRVVDGGIEIARGSAEHPDAVLSTSPGTLSALLWEGLHLRQAERSGAAEVEGDRPALARFLRLFPIGD